MTWHERRVNNNIKNLLNVNHVLLTAGPVINCSRPSRTVLHSNKQQTDGQKQTLRYTRVLTCVIAIFHQYYNNEARSTNISVIAVAQDSLCRSDTAEIGQLVLISPLRKWTHTGMRFYCLGTEWRKSRYWANTRCEWFPSLCLILLIVTEWTAISYFRDGSSFLWHQPCQRCKYTTSVDI